MPDVAPLDPERLVTTLARHGVRYVLIGALAARMQGFPRVTADADSRRQAIPRTWSNSLRHFASSTRGSTPRQFPKGSRSTAARRCCRAPKCGTW